MKKILFILVLGIFIVLPFISLASANESVADIAYIIRDANHIDNILTGTINESYSYEIITEREIRNTNFSQYKMILVGDGLFSNPDSIPVNNFHSLIINSKYYDQWGWSGSAGQITASFLELRNNKVNITITESLNELFFAYTDRAISAYYLSGRKPVGLVKVSTGENSAGGEPFVAYVNKGTRMLNGNATKGRSLFFGITETNYWTEETKQLFKNSLDWTIIGQDRDGDEYFDSDCNDDNRNLWQLISGYQDSDGDRFGRMNLLAVCSGENLPEGYVNITGDCDDTKNNVNPNSAEIPYDGLDNDCSAGDLVDVDGDGFDAAVIGENDCNDNDASININSSDVLKNCVNDAPILNSQIPIQTWAEDSYKELNLSDYFKDPENEQLIYSIDSVGNEVSVSIIGDIARFIGNLNWFGDNWIIFEASDGTNEILSNEINLKVNPVNDAPVLEPIDDIYVIAGQTVSVVPRASDVDGDSFEYEFSLPLNESGQWKTNEGDENEYLVNVRVTDIHGGIDIKYFKIFVMPKFKINEVFFGNEGWVELYNPGSKNVNLADCLIINNENSYSLNGNISVNEIKEFDIPNLSYTGKTEIKCNEELVDEISFGDLEDQAPIPGENQSVGRVLDGINQFVLFDIPTKGLSNTADMINPTVTLENTNSIIEIRNVNLGFNVSDNSENVTCELYSGITGFDKISTIIVSLINGFAHGDFSLTGLDDGVYNWNVRCKDARNSAFALNNGSFEISAPDSPVLNLISGRTINENQTLEFTVSAFDRDNDSLSYNAENLPRGATFASNKFSWKPDFEQSGFYNIKFIAVDNSNLSDSEIVRITVNNVKLPPKFSDAGQCGNSDEIGIEIKNPDNNDQLTIGDIIDVDARIKNFGDGKKFSINAYLYDAINEEVVESSEIPAKISNNENYDAELQLNIPENINESSEYVIYVTAESGSLCNSKFIYVKPERADDKVIIKKFDIEPLSVINGENVNLRVKIQNIGNGDQDELYITIKNSELKLNIKSEFIELEAYGGDDSITKQFTFTIPENVTAKDYEISVNVLYNGEISEIVKKITVANQDNSNDINTNNTQTYQISIPADEQNTRTYAAIANTQATNIINDKNVRTFKDEELRLKIYSEEKNPIITTGKTEYQKIPEYLKDSRINLLIYLLNGVLIIGILVFILRLIFYFRR